MSLQSTQNPGTSLVLSADAKPRLKWTPELHQRFIDAVNQIGGPDKATPKSLMRVMGIPSLTLYHLKSHLQKYRLGKHQPAETCSDSNQEDCKDNPGELDLFREQISNPALDPIKKESLQITQAIQMQMEVQRKLHEQIEVQRHLQLRIEAQGKYLQKVLKKAQETLAGCTSSSMGAEYAKAEISQLASMVSSGCFSSSLSELTEMRDSCLEDLDRQIQMKGPMCSVESSLTTSETSDLKEKELKISEDEDACKLRHTPVALPLLDQPQPWISGLSNQVSDRKKRGDAISQGESSERPTSKRLHIYKEMDPGLGKLGLCGTLDLNSPQSNHESGQAPIDLNYTETDQFNDVPLIP